jgi:hypothetical protein
MKNTTRRQDQELDQICETQLLEEMQSCQLVQIESTLEGRVGDVKAFIASNPLIYR